MPRHGKLDEWLPPEPQPQGFDAKSRQWSKWDAEFQARVTLLFRHYMISNGDWMRLALALASDHVKGFQTKPPRGAAKRSDSYQTKAARAELLTIVLKESGGNLKGKVSRICARLAGPLRQKLPLFYAMKPGRKALAYSLEKELRRALAEKAVADAIERMKIMSGQRPPPEWLDTSNWTSPFDPSRK